ncbi:MAG TPA: biosynthetic peptidoglycan transglycosylase [Streptosporangiaceae bacterium]
MAAGGSADEQTRPNGWPAQPPPYSDSPHPIVPGMSGQRPRRRRRVFRVLRAVAALATGAIVLGALGFGGVLLVTPSVGNARELVRAQDQLHGVSYPGPPAPPRFTAALEATEDHRFNSEPGVDPIAVGRVMLATLAGHGTDQGGATLYQQLAKLLYTPGRSGLIAEAEQVALAVKLKFSYSGAEILRMYSNVAYFGHNFYGLANASCGYFGTTPQRLSWPQAALMAGLVQGPSVDDPLRFPAAAQAREQHVIGRLVATGALTSEQAKAALAIPLGELLKHAGQDCTS